MPLVRPRLPRPLLSAGHVDARWSDYRPLSSVWAPVEVHAVNPTQLVATCTHCGTSWDLEDQGMCPGCEACSYTVSRDDLIAYHNHEPCSTGEAYDRYHGA